jgi:cation diffusion facilitator family transporter
MSNLKTDAIIEKRRIALTSVIAALFLTAFKTIVGISTGSLGILSEALHSGLDLVAATITFFAVKYADRPADDNHHYGHGKIENYSALIETLLLLITCFWIIYEAIKRLVLKEYTIEVTYWSYVVIVSSIIIDISRSRALKRVAIKHNSQALEADALHFSTDIWSSLVVLVGIVGATFSFHLADPIAALLVACVVLYVCYKLGKKSYDALVDRAPKGIEAHVMEVVAFYPAIQTITGYKARESGPSIFIEFNAHLDKQLNLEEAHRVVSLAENDIKKKIKNCDIIIHIEPI